MSPKILRWNIWILNLGRSRAEMIRLEEFQIKTFYLVWLSALQLISYGEYLTPLNEFELMRKPFIAEKK